MKTKEVALKYQGTEFFMKVADGGELINITDIWRGEGAVETKKPDNWLHISETAEFIVTCLKSVPDSLLANKPDPHRGSKNAIRAWAETIIKECEKQGLIKRTKGRSGGTYAHWQIAMAYAKYLSPELHIIVNQVFRERLQETIDPDFILWLWHYAENLGITMTDEFGKLLFVAKDVCEVLGYANAPAIIAKHCKPKGIVKHNTLTGSELCHGR